ncbi:MAG: FG-GAP-like repeat-containing protein [Nitrospirota bacterium]|nr:FG-GAP-like repeat-containing protein [Nitrospirota bacterium]
MRSTLILLPLFPLLLHGVAVPPPTTTKLAVSATQVTSLQSVKLVATVTSNFGVASVAPGTITFYDGTTVLGSAQLATQGTIEPAGTATLVVRLGTGTHHVTAAFAGTKTAPPSTSGSQSITVTGTIPTTTTLTSQGQGQCNSSGTCSFSTTLIGTVTNAGPLAPTGTVNFIDTSNSNYVIGTGALSPSTPSLTFGNNGNPISTSAPPNARSIASGDFNGDGVPDLAVADEVGNNLGVLLGNDNGTFQTQVSYSAGISPQSIATGDFNNDGALDLVLANTGENTVSVLLGNGDGTFRTQVKYTVGNGPAGVRVSDFNADGNLDLAVVNGTDGTVSVLLGNGDGTFQTEATYPVGHAPDALAIADFNEDSKPDVAVANSGDGTIGVLLGVGDGTLHPQVIYSVGSGPNAVAASDLNADGKPDLTVVNGNDHDVSILLGNGDGTFQNQVTYAVGTAPNSVAAADLNGDGKPDLAVANGGDIDVGVLFGNGDGTFQGQVTYGVNAGPSSVVIGDFNTDGFPDIAVAAGNSVNVLLNSTQSASASYTFNTQFIPGAGTHEVEAVYVGDSSHARSASPPTAFGGQLISTSVTVSASPNTGVLAGQPVKLTATVQPTPAYGYTATGTVTFYDNGNLLGSAPVKNGAAILTTTTLPVGVDTITASYSGDTNFTSSQSSSYLITISPVQDFSISVIPPTETAYRGILAVFILKLQSIKGFDNNVQLSCSGGPPGSECADLPQTVHVNGTAYALSGILFPKKTKPGVYTVTFTGASGSLTHSATASFTVK